MAGSALGQIGAVAMGLVGLISIVKNRYSKDQPDPDTDRRAREAHLMERRMASYLASRGDPGEKVTPDHPKP